MGCGWGGDGVRMAGSLCRDELEVHGQRWVPGCHLDNLADSRNDRPKIISEVVSGMESLCSGEG